ncbi:MAG: non-ribosomal peptide synthetase, partial [Acidobacteria bacterium]
MGDQARPLGPRGAGGVALAAPSPAATLHQLIAAQVERTPDAVALCWGNETLTYRRLERRANHLAHRLRRRGVGPESVVGVLLERGLTLPVALLGVLKAGGAFVVLDPDDPPARRRRLLADAGVAVVVREPAAAGEPAADTPRPATVEIDGDDPPGDDPGPPAAAVTPENLAYVVFTSGSSGRPKGVLGSHRGIVAYLRSIVERFALGPHDVALQLARPTFDGALRDLFAPLAAGARVVLPDRAAARDPAALVAALEGERVSVVPSVVPALLEQLLAVAEERGRRLPHLRLVLSAGES